MPSSSSSSSSACSRQRRIALTGQEHADWCSAAGRQESLPPPPPPAPTATPTHPPARVVEREAQALHHLVGVLAGMAGDVELHTHREALEAEVEVLAGGALDAQGGGEVLVAVVAVVKALAARGRRCEWEGAEQVQAVRSRWPQHWHMRGHRQEELQRAITLATGSAASGWTTHFLPPVALFPAGPSSRRRLFLQQVSIASAAVRPQVSALGQGLWHSATVARLHCDRRSSCGGATAAAE